jgi:D-alanyl-D-alanine carboxypeptidase/D-alanyl-D-alanine-endopeptidase (penicillin-binding protein 4)
LVVILTLQPSYSKSKEEIKAEVNKLLKHKYLKNVNYSIQLISKDTKETLLNIGEKKAFTPASTIKLLTTACALNKLPKDFQLKTIICSETEIKNNIISGNIYLKGYGNPLLSSSDIEDMATTLSIKGLRIIEGNIIIDDTYLDSKLFRNEWIDSQENSFEESAISAVTVDNNSLYVRLNSSEKINSTPELFLYSELNELKIVNNVKTANITRRKETVSISLKDIDDQYTLTLTGKIGKNRTKYLNVKIKKPSLFCGTVLRSALASRGISVRGVIKNGKLPTRYILLAQHNLPIEDLISIINKNSDNFCADQLLKIIGAETGLKNGSAKNGISTIYSYLKENRIDTANLRIYDGSGLSRKNKLNSNTLAQLLYNITNNKEIFESFYNSLSCAGVDGTLKYRMNNVFESADIRGKTGTLRDVTSIAGYVTSPDNELLIFTIFMDNVKFGVLELRNIQDKIIELFSEFSRNY